MFTYMPNNNPPVPTTTVQKREPEYETKAGTKKTVQLTTTIPKSLAEAIGIGPGDEIEWGIQSGERLWIGLEE